MKTCVFITGTNAVGKSSLAKALIARYGGIKSASKTLTVCRNERVCLAGHYENGSKYGGVDTIKNDKGSSCTSLLEGVVREGLSSHDIILCEGMYLHTFGINLTNAAFVADKQLLVFLYCPVQEIHRRLLERSGKGLTNDAVWKKQLNCATAAKKWASIGVPVLSIDTSQIGTDAAAQMVINKIDELCGVSTTAI